MRALGRLYASLLTATTKGVAESVQDCEKQKLKPIKFTRNYSTKQIPVCQRLMSLPKSAGTATKPPTRLRAGLMGAPATPLAIALTTKHRTVNPVRSGEPVNGNNKNYLSITC